MDRLFPPVFSFCINMDYYRIKRLKSPYENKNIRLSRQTDVFQFILKTLRMIYLCNSLLETDRIKGVTAFKYFEKGGKSLPLKNSVWKNICKIILAAILFLITIFSSNWISTNICRYLEKSNTSLLFRYASDGKFSSNIYLSEEVRSQYGISDNMFFLLKQDDSGSLVDLSRDISKYQLELIPVFSQNQDYLSYLQKNDTSISEFFTFCEKISELADNVSFACRYLFFLLWVILIHLLIRCRPALYFSMGIICIVASLFKLSGKLAAAYLFADSGFFHMFADDIIPALLEAMLTFLIFDITIASMEKVRLSHRLEKLYEDLPSLQFLIVFLSAYINSETRYKSDISHILPNFNQYLQKTKRSRKKAVRLADSIRSLSNTHTNRTFLRDLVQLQTLLPPK